MLNALNSKPNNDYSFFGEEYFGPRVEEGSRGGPQRLGLNQNRVMTL